MSTTASSRALTGRYGRYGSSSCALTGQELQRHHTKRRRVRTVRLWQGMLVYIINTIQNIGHTTQVKAGLMAGDVWLLSFAGPERCAMCSVCVFARIETTGVYA